MAQRNVKKQKNVRKNDRKNVWTGWLRKAARAIHDTIFANYVTTYLFALTVILAIVGYLTTIFTFLQPEY